MSNNTPIDSCHLFGKKNILFIIVACVLIITGFILMSGSGSTNNFNPAIFSTRRIVIAPMFCLAGYLLVIVGILWKK